MTSQATAPVPSIADSSVETRMRSEAIVVRHGLWSLLGKFGNVAVSFLYTVIVARILSPSDFADLNSLRTLVTVIAIAMAAGLSQITLRELGRRQSSAGLTDRGIIKHSLTAFLRSGFTCAILGGGTIWLCSDSMLRNGISVSHIAIATVGAVLMGASELLSEMHRGLHYPSQANLFGGTRGTPATSIMFIFMLFVAAVFVTPTFLIANTLLVAATLITCVVAAFSLRWIVKQKPQIDSKNRKDLTSVSASQILTESLPLTLSAIISFIIVQGDLVLSGWIPDAGESSSYVGAKKCVQLITIPLLVVNTMASGIIIPLLANSQKALLQQVLRGFCGIATIPALILGLFFCLVPEFSLQLILGEGYSSGANTLRILAVGQIASVVTGSCGAVLLLTGCQRVILILNGLGLVTFLCFGPFAAMRFGATGLAVVVSGIFVVHNMASLFSVRKFAGVNTLCSFREALRLRSLLPSASQARSNKDQLDI